MTQVLASVRNQAEAQIVLDSCAVGVLDMKEPQNGALGAMALSEIRSIQSQVNAQANSQVSRRCKTSATIGDLPPDPDKIRQAVEQTMECGVDYIKVGLFGSEYFDDCLATLSQLATRIPLVAVLFADRFQHFAGPCEIAKAANFCGVMIDTADKQLGSVFDIVSYHELEEFVATAKRLGLLCGIAGSLRFDEIAKGLALAPDYIGFRGALCDEGKREQGISVESLRCVVDEVKRCAA